jgi:hypothetical protein
MSRLAALESSLFCAGSPHSVLATSHDAAFSKRTP